MLQLRHIVNLYAFKVCAFDSYILIYKNHKDNKKKINWLLVLLFLFLSFYYQSFLIEFLFRSDFWQQPKHSFTAYFSNKQSQYKFVSTFISKVQIAQKFSSWKKKISSRNVLFHLFMSNMRGRNDNGMSQLLAMTQL